MNKKQIIIGVVVLVVIGGAVYYFAQQKKKKGLGAGTTGGEDVPIGKKTKTVSWAFTDNTYTSSGKSQSNLGFIGLTKPPFTVGTVVDITQDAGATFPSYNGKTHVEHIYSKGGKWIVDVTKKREGNTPVNGGTMTGKIVVNQ